MVRWVEHSSYMTGRTNPEDPKDEKYRTEQEGKIRILVGRMGIVLGGIHSIIHPVNIIHIEKISIKYAHEYVGC